MQAERHAERLRQSSTIDVYGRMWGTLSAWCVGEGVALDQITAADLERFLNSRGGADELSARYAWRFLRLVDRILAEHARMLGGEPNGAAETLLRQRPDYRFANAADKDPLPAFLPAGEAKRLVTFLSAVRPTRTSVVHVWQDVRNRASVALMLGAGLTPGEVRALRLGDAVVEGGRHRGVPWKVRIKGHAESPERETPLAAWAGQLLAFWLAVRLEQGIPGEALLPSTKTGKPWGKISQYEATREVLGAASIDDVAGGSFKLRHTFALRQLRRGRAPEEVARWLGVTDPAVMSRYLRALPAPVDVA